MNINILEISGFATALTALRKPFKKEIRSLINSNFNDIAIEKDINQHPADTIVANIPNHYWIGIYEKDLKLMQTLVKSGDDHAKAIRFINVSFELNAPRYIWSEMDTYQIGKVQYSESTMHTILKEEISHSNFAKDFDSDIIDTFIKKVDSIKEKDILTKEKIRLIKQILPEGYLQERVVQMNYQTLRRIYFQRKNHRLSEWQEFCKWIEKLPLANELITIQK